jgi:hypothetical protein
VKRTATTDSFFDVLLETDSAQAASMTLQPGQSTGGPENRHPDSDQWLYVVADWRNPRSGERRRRPGLSVGCILLAVCYIDERCHEQREEDHTSECFEVHEEVIEATRGDFGCADESEGSDTQVKANWETESEIRYWIFDWIEIDDLPSTGLNRSCQREQHGKEQDYYGPCSENAAWTVQNGMVILHQM